MVVKCLGCGNAFGSGGRFNTGFYIRTQTNGILLDCGASILIALKKQNLSAEDVDLVLITHLHGDHFGGLPFMLCEIVAEGKRKKPLTIIGPEGTREKTVQGLECFYPGVELRADSLIKFITYKTQQELEINGVRIMSYKAIHSPATNPHCLRIEADDIVTYSGDTEWTEDLITASEGADLFICEASAYAQPMKNHLSVNELITHQSRINARKIVLTHLGEEALQHMDEIPFEVASDGAILFGKWDEGK